jgi:hypothetical protein
VRKPVPNKPGRQQCPEAAQSKQPAALNLRLYAQTRKILSKHYRTKYGMRQGRGGR